MVQTISYLQSNLLAEAKTQTQTRNDTEGNKILIATYTDERELEAAIAELARIPLDEQPDIDFYNLFMALIEDLIANPSPEYDDGSGKAQIPLMQAIEAEALPDTKEAINIMAQSVKAARQHIAYNRSPNYKEQTTKTSNETAQTQLYVTPNPAQTVAILAWNTPCNGILVLYDFTGKIVLQRPVSGKSSVLDLNTMSNGTFIGRVTSNGETIALGKIVVIK